jgi:hypothetical protein
MISDDSKCVRLWWIDREASPACFSVDLVGPSMKLTWEMLRDAVATYLQHAYPNGQVPDRVRKRVTFDEARPIVESLTEAPFEKYTAKAPAICTVYALRLGSSDYPNVKMEIRPFPNPFGFVFWVNTHDDFFTVHPEAPDADLWREVVSRNRDMKQAVERAWARLKLPTFISTMQEDGELLHS